jgi:hypothetical protein
MANDWPLHSAQPDGAKLNPNANTAPMYPVIKYRFFVLKMFLKLMTSTKTFDLRLST